MGKWPCQSILAALVVLLAPMGGSAQDEPNVTCQIGPSFHTVTCSACWPFRQQACATVSGGSPLTAHGSPAVAGNTDRFVASVGLYQLMKKVAELQSKNEDLTKQLVAQKVETDRKVVDANREMTQKLAGLGQEFIRDPVVYSALLAKLIDDPAVYDAMKAKLSADYPRTFPKKD